MSVTGMIEPQAMEARSVDEIPCGETWQYEPKWDGFRCLLQRTGRVVALTSKSGQDLKRYFPELAAAAAELPDQTFLIDGEIVVPVGATFSFDALLQRIHPAATRIRRLAEATPALFLAFDLLHSGRSDLAKCPLALRRPKLEDFAARCFKSSSASRLSLASHDVKIARR
jgi:ATP-dependent DNA ligase